MKEIKITRINEGLCQSRIQLGKPPYYLNWNQDGENMGEFFAQPAAREKAKQKLIKAGGALAYV